MGKILRLLTAVGIRHLSTLEDLDFSLRPVLFFISINRSGKLATLMGLFCELLRCSDNELSVSTVDGKGLIPSAKKQDGLTLQSVMV